MLKDIWQFWIDFTEFRAIRACYMDEIMFGNSFKVRKWWGYKHIPFLEYINKDSKEA